MKKFRALILGAGGAGSAIADSMKEGGRAEPAAFVETRAERRESLAAEYPQAIVGVNYPEILEQSDPDIVVVAGPDHLHAEQSILALQHGCHVLIEKPMATTLADTRALLDAEAKTDRHVMVDFTMRYAHPWATMARMAKNGDIGRVFCLHGYYIHDMWDWYSTEGKCHTAWRVDKQNPQNILMGGGCHGLDLMLWIMEGVPVTEVFAYSNHLSGSDIPTDDCFQVSMRFQNGVLGEIFAASGCNTGTCGPMLDVYGQDGTLSDGKLLRRGHEPMKLKDTDDFKTKGGHGWPASVSDFLDTLDGKIENPVPSLVGARNVAICEAALISARDGGGQPVEWFE